MACAVHAGSALRPEVVPLLGLTAAERLVEEDPYTDDLTRAAATRLVVHRSRFEVDMNRSRDRAVYRAPADAWGLPVWPGRLPGAVEARSLRLYDRFYADLAGVCARAGEVQGRQRGRPFVVLDLHSYNHRRGGPGAPPADPARNPEINIGTGSLDRARWGGLVDTYANALSAVTLPSLGRGLDVRENVRFRGGHLSRWVHETFPGNGCALAIEVKKFFMDEHTGALDEAVWADVRRALGLATAALSADLAGLRRQATALRS